MWFIVSLSISLSLSLSTVLLVDCRRYHYHHPSRLLPLLIRLIDIRVGIN